MCGFIALEKKSTTKKSSMNSKWLSRKQQGEYGKAWGEFGEDRTVSQWLELQVELAAGQGLLL